MVRASPLGLLIACGVFLSGCAGNAPEGQPSIATAYAGPATLNLRADIDPKSPVVAVARHGDKLEIIAQRRRWYKVRTTRRAEGWTTDRELLDSAQMRRLKDLEKETKGLPSQGAATTFSALNVHSEPSRQAPSFVQVEPKEQFDVIAHRVVERVPLPKHELIPKRPKFEKKAFEKRSSVPLPPAPAPPSPPKDLLTLSKEREPDPEDIAEEEKQIPHDDWTLIRLPNGESGWVLTSAIYLGIPDEVAQYAEGKRITSYFSLGKIRDGDAQKDIWLWTTSVSLGEDHDFDSYRVFVWSLNHHRYETAYIQRRERGFFPTSAKRGEFSVCLEQDDGTRIRKKYQMQGNRVAAAGVEPCAKPADLDRAAGGQEASATKNKPGLLARIESRVQARFRALLKR